MGASAAWHLARAGAEVTLISGLSKARNYATNYSFGWVGTGANLPSDKAYSFGLHLQAVREFTRIERDLGPLSVAVRGALIWWETEQATATFLAEQKAAGVRMEAVSQMAIAAREPGLALRPELAAWAPDDFALEPAQLVSQFIEAARELGAVIEHGVAEAVMTTGGRTTGIRVDGAMVPADIVVLANGFGARSLSTPLGIDLPLKESPAVLTRLQATASIRHLLCGSGLELRPTFGGGLSSAADFPPNGEGELSALAMRNADSVAQVLGLAIPPVVLSVTAAQRPMPIGREPLCSFVGAVEGLYVIVAHPGITFAPLLGRLATEDIMHA